MTVVLVVFAVLLLCLVAALGFLCGFVAGRKLVLQDIARSGCCMVAGQIYRMVKVLG